MNNPTPAQTLDELLNTASVLPDDRTNYANAVRVNVGANDVLLDFFYIAPSPPDNMQLKVRHIQRMILPLSTAKEIGEILMNSLEQWQATFGVELPFAPLIVGDDMEEQEKKE